MATQTMLLALEALGYGGVLLSGQPAYDPHVKRAFGLAEKDAIVGFLYVGTPSQERREKKRPDPAPFVAEWSGPAA
jgi:nitroreductase